MIKVKLFLMLFFATVVLGADSLSQEIKVGIIMDAQTSGYQKIKDELSTELKLMTQSEFNVHFVNPIIIDWSIIKAQAALEKLQNNPDIDLIITIGLVSANIALKETKLTKPTFAPYLLHFEQQPIVVKQNLNYLYFSTPFDIALKNFLDVVNFKNMTLIVDEKLSSSLPEAMKSLKKSALEKGINLHLFVINSKNSFKQIPLDTQAVMLTPLPSLDFESKKELIDDLIKRRIPSYSFGDDLSVYDGVMISSFSRENISRRIRQLALNIHSVLRGEDPRQLPNKFEDKHQLIINLKTTNKIGVYPPFDILNKSKLIEDDKESQGDEFSLSDVAKLAIKNNLNIIAGELEIKLEDENIKEIRSVLLPQVTGDITYTQHNSDNIYVKNGFYAHKSSTGAIKLHQVLFSEKALAALDIQKKFKTASVAQQRTLEMDIVEQTSTLFLDILIAQTQLKVEQENLKLTKSNLDMAQARVDAGSSDLSELYHWESRIATSKQGVLQVKAVLEQAQDALNLILHRPITSRIKTIPATLDDPSLLISNKELLSLITNENEIKLINNYFVKEGLKSASELQMYDAYIAAQKRKLVSQSRAYYSPDIELVGEMSRVFDEKRNPSTGTSLEDQTNWSASFVLSLPLYEGSARSARFSESQLKLQQLQLSKDYQKNSIEQQIRYDLHTIRSSYPSIKLTKQAAKAAKKSFNLVQNNYAKGTRSMSDLLIAQNETILADQKSASAIYKFLKDLMNLQRDIGKFDFFMDESERKLYTNRFSQIINNSDNQSSPISKVK
ncbi:outer membrane efflux protein [Sulfurimonas lithotrophica]|uniref:Outer membrane efflux protein n=1 Tax=Sulfurimonas lithotrophica TaxID=2590022 RepID=A0A5P8P056_9BACT|nr:TolC family protein [Sulfurimonas lithotrophica]QFR49089.1 outer membrane efflux protein [Sulfurimonas lithotrophica]